MKSISTKLSPDELLLQELNLMHSIASDCDYVPSKEKFAQDKYLLNNLMKYFAPKKLTRAQMKELCAKYENQSPSFIQSQLTELKVKLNPDLINRIQDIKAAMIVASQFSGYCVDFKELKKSSPELITRFLTEGISQARIKAFCEEFSGNRRDEISNYLTRL